MNRILQSKYETLLLEKKLTNDSRKDIIKKFLKFAFKELGIKDAPKVFLNHSESFGPNNKSFGHFYVDENRIVVATSNRNLADILRTLAHELVHCHQKQEGKVDMSNAAENGADGSPIENEANSKAAVLMRRFGRMNPSIYE